MNLDILAIGAHPDDVEISVGATLAKEINKGKKIGILDLTRGELGTRGSSEIRNAEANKAADILGVTIRENINLDDGFFSNDREHQLKIIEIIRKYKPNIVLGNSITDRHPDHGRANKLISTACFLSGLDKIKTVFEGELQKSFRPKAVYSYVQWMPIKPDFVVDITGFMDIKMKAIKAYTSQFYDPKSTEPETPISKEGFLDSIEYRARDLGRIIGTEYAEAFNVERYIGVKSIFDLI
ncbi:bacillithiol biosynthesis deacetylase BshB1 [Ichthyobacterium seriolicida]|uniref:GlcNAc-PI de-N-acetylase n=1 Tax=Ichthyobacterium seriolicida TaxID=242600 RepID=A0A1J1E4T7_9FLAO|nr:bacillithiol biosynthesis deacetylase BshB1 [Ichthyobacterium seriolicida]BAV95068.1 GlcNAc-PI de-N-acetylase [Ichthyobacterium seriolicida]